ncbi:MAG: hypothetical protein LBL01_06370 [Bifidobacteriaceae bacterium]|jgi:curved DNA-binding protein CbpA|nr:hypothetical protein [Bifidobacteriaceae bacterium]
MAEETYYELVGVPEDASVVELSRALQDARREWSNRRSRHPKESVRLEAQAKLEAVTRAEETLLDPELRAGYDRALAEARAAAASGIRIAPDAGGRAHGIGQGGEPAAPAPAPVAPPGADVTARARRYTDAGEWRLAYRFWGQATSLAPEDAAAWREWAWAALEMMPQADAQRAESLLDDALMGALEAVRLDPENGSAHYVLGKARLATGDKDQALRAFIRATAFDPELAWARVEMSRLSVASGDVVMGLAEMRRGADQLKAQLGDTPEVAAVYAEMAALTPRLSLGGGGARAAQDDADRASASPAPASVTTPNVGAPEVYKGPPSAAMDRFSAALAETPAKRGYLDGLQDLYEALHQVDASGHPGEFPAAERDFDELAGLFIGASTAPNAKKFAASPQAALNNARAISVFAPAYQSAKDAIAFYERLTALMEKYGLYGVSPQDAKAAAADLARLTGADQRGFSVFGWGQPM